jgi:hypothetical protein
MEYFDAYNVLYFVLFWTFINYQHKHLQNFNGRSVIVEFLLSIYTIVGMIVSLIFLAYYGIMVVWWAPFVLFIIGIIGMSFMVFIKRIIGLEVLSILGFLICPVFAYLMFATIPNM